MSQRIFLSLVFLAACSSTKPEATDDFSFLAEGQRGEIIDMKLHDGRGQFIAMKFRIAHAAKAAQGFVGLLEKIRVSAMPYKRHRIDIAESHRVMDARHQRPRRRWIGREVTLLSPAG